MNLTALIVGNVCSLFAMGTDAISSSRKKVSTMLWIQNASQLFYAIGSVLLKGYSGAVQNVVCIIRNLIVIKGNNSKIVGWVLVFLGAAAGLLSNNIGFAGLLPILANLQYTLAMFQFPKNERVLKISFLITSILFIFFCLKIWNFIGVITNAIVAISTIIALVTTKHPVPQKQEDL